METTKEETNPASNKDITVSHKGISFKPSEPRVFTYELSEEWRVQRILDKINKKAEKLGLPKVYLSVLKTTDYEGNTKEYLEAVKNGGEVPNLIGKHKKITVEVMGEAPYIQGWQLMGGIEYFRGTTIIKEVPGQYIPRSYWEKSNSCDHCGTKRRRKDTYILKKDDEYKQIGRNCLADFFPGIDPSNVAQAVTFYTSGIKGIGEEKEQFFRDRYFIQDELFELDFLLPIICAFIRVDGFISKTNNPDYNTSGDVKSLLLGPPSGKERKKWEEWREERKVTDVDIEKAKAVIEWGQKIDPNHNSYFHNLHQYFSVGCVNWKGIGIITSSVFAFDGERSRKINDKKEEKSNCWVGKEKERLRNLKLTVTKKSWSDGQWGTTEIVSFEDEHGNWFTWFSSNMTDTDIGDTVNLTGTVKKHDEYRGRKQTIITRCIIHKEEENEEGKELEAGNSV